MIGLRTAWRESKLIPDPVGVEFVRGNNRKALVALAKLIAVLCDGQPGARFFLGSTSLAETIGTSQRTALNMMKQLERQGFIRRVWTGGLCVRDPDGKNYAGGGLAKRASEYEFVGFREAVATCNQNLLPVLSSYLPLRTNREPGSPKDRGGKTARDEGEPVEEHREKVSGCAAGGEAHDEVASRRAPAVPLPTAEGTRLRWLIRSARCGVCDPTRPMRRLGRCDMLGGRSAGL